MNPNGEKKSPTTPATKRRNATNVLDHFRTVVDRRYCTEAKCSKKYSLNSATTTLMYHLSGIHQIAYIDDEN